jgi:hypothetical protein
MSNQERTPEELERFRVEAERKAEQVRDGLKRLELARRWLPETIYEHVHNLLRFQLRPEMMDLDTVIRLAADQRMRSVWELLSPPRVDAHKALEYFELALKAPGDWKRDDSVIAEKRRVENVADLCGKLATLLEQKPFYLTETKKVVVRNGVCYSAHTIGEFLADPRTGVYPYSLADGLTALRDYCCRKLAEHRQRLPRKITHSSACRTYVIRQLSKFMREVLGQPYHERVASTVEVVLDLPEEESRCLDGDFVRKVTRNL